MVIKPQVIYYCLLEVPVDDILSQVFAYRYKYEYEYDLRLLYTTKNSFASANIRHFQGKNQVTNSAPDTENSRRR